LKTLLFLKTCLKIRGWPNFAYDWYSVDDTRLKGSFGITLNVFLDEKLNLKQADFS